MVDNAIIIENQKKGTPQAIWDAPATNQIEGFTTDISVNHGADISFKINLNVAAGVTAPYHIEIYRLGYYGGDGATLVTTINGLTGVAQPNPITDARGVVDAGNWSVSATWHTPDDATSGIYLAKLVRDDNGGTNQIPFIVRDDGSHSDIVLQTSDTTWQAYNGWAGNNGEVGGNLYGGFLQPPDIAPDVSPECNGACLTCTCSYNRTFAVSYDRPIITRDGGGVFAGAQDSVYGADYAAVSFLEKNGYDVSYISGLDTDRLGASYLQQHKAFISVGHDEYWSGDQRANVEAARDAGVNLLFWSGNEVYWKTRWEPSIADGTEDRTLVSYKETKFNYSLDATASDYPNIDPSNDWTGTWRDVRFVNAVGPDGTPIAAGARPENSLTGQLFIGDGTGQFGAGLDVPSDDAGLRFWRDTSVQADGGATDLAPGILGYEWDTSPDDASRPAGLIKLSDTTIQWDALLTDEGNRTEPGEATHTLTLYRAPSGALVFGAGAVFWSWGLSDSHDGSPYDAQIANPALQQFTLNLFADMGIQPGVSDEFLANEGLVRASASDDHVAATAITTTIPDSAPALSAVIISGTATDDDDNPSTTDGHVALVEVSVDGGQTWRVADGTTHWSFNWLPTAPGTYTVLSRAIDDSLNLPASGQISSHTITIGEAVKPSSFSLFGPTVTPTGNLYNDGQAIELGMKFQASEAGTVTALRYLRDVNDSTDTDVRQGHLWSADGTLLGTVTFTSAPGESGWQVATLNSPVAIQAGTTYVVSYHTEDNYLAADNYFASAVSDPFNELTAPSSASAGGNGVFAYGDGQAVPDQTYGGANYWVDVEFTPNSAPPATPHLLAASDTGASNTDAITSDSTPTLVGTAVAGSTVKLFDKTTVLGTTTADANGDWSITTPVLADGTHILTVTATTSGGTSPASAGLTVDIDTTAPFAPARPNLTLDSDNGAANNDGVTSVITPTFVGMAAAQDGGRASPNEAGGTSAYETGGTVTLYEGSKVLGTSVIDGVGHWQITSTPLSIGDHAITAQVTDLAGNTGPMSAVKAVTIVAGPPAAPSTPDLATASDSGAINTDNLTNDNTPTLTGTAAAGSTVQLLDGAAAVGSVVADQNGNWSITTTALADGAHALTATATTTGGTSPASASLTVTIDTTPPGAPAAPDMTAASDDGASDTDNVTSVTTPVFLITVAGETGGAVTLYDGGTAIGTTANFSSGNWLVASSALSPGAHSITARATDMAGNVGPMSAALPITIGAQASGYNVFAPSVTPAGALHNDAQPVELGMKFQAAEAGTVTALRYWRDAGDAGDTDTRAGHLWSSSGALLGTATFTSTPGQSGWQTANLSTPVTLEAGQTYIVSYHTDDNYLVATNYFTSAVTSPGGELTAPSTSSAGGNGVYLYGSDLSVPNQSYAASNYWTDVVFNPAGTAAPSTPDLLASTDSGSSSTDNLTNDNTPTLVGTAAVGATVKLFDGAAQVGSATADASGNWSITTTGLADGSHVLTATATGVAGVSAPSGALTVKIDTAAPAAPSAPDLTTASDDGVSSTDNATSVTTPTFTGTGETGAVVTLYEGSTALGSAVVDALGNWSITSSALGVGGHAITARAVDAAGNSGAASSALQVTIVAPAGGYSLFGSSVTPSGALHNDAQPVELGVKFQASEAGTVTALRYWRDAGDAGDTDTRAGHLWSSNGSLLGTVTFTSAPGQSGWQTANLSTPVTLQAGETYIVSYHTDDNYLVASNYFASAVTGPGGELSAPSDSTAGGNGVYLYGSGLSVPSQSYAASNYWADVVFAPSPPSAAAMAAPDVLETAEAASPSTDGAGVTMRDLLLQRISAATVHTTGDFLL